VGAWTCELLERMRPPVGPFFVSDGRLIVFDFDEAHTLPGGGAAPDDEATHTVSGASSPAEAPPRHADTSHTGCPDAQFVL